MVRFVALLIATFVVMMWLELHGFGFHPGVAP